MANEKHLLLTWSGGWTDPDIGDEIWQNGVRLVLNHGPIDDVGAIPSNWDVVSNVVSRTETDWRIDGNWEITGSASSFHPDDYLNDQVAPALIALWGARSAFSNKCRLDQVKLYPIGTNGKAIPAPPYALGAPMTLTWTSDNPVGGNSGNLLPLQNSIVVSHRTNQLGRRGRGRNYWPGSTVSAVGADGLISSADAGYNAGFEAAFLEAIALHGDLTQPFSIRPAVIGHPWEAYAVITQVQCGRVVDTQRRRRNKLNEARSSVPVSY